MYISIKLLKRLKINKKLIKKHFYAIIIHTIHNINLTEHYIYLNTRYFPFLNLDCKNKSKKLSKFK